MHRRTMSLLAIEAVGTSVSKCLPTWNLQKRSSLWRVTRHTGLDAAWVLVHAYVISNRYR
jgi:hypothetical protein